MNIYSFIPHILGITWMISEIILILQTYKKSGKDKKYEKNTDNNSMKIVWLCIFISIAVAVISQFFNLTPLTLNMRWILPVIGSIIIFIGIFIRRIAISTLKKAFTVNVVVSEDQKVIKHGIYKYLRHPSYTGIYIAIIGIALAFQSWVTIIVMPLVVFLGLFYRINVEEKVLSNFFGDEYIEYSKNTYRMIPFVF